MSVFELNVVEQVLPQRVLVQQIGFELNAVKQVVSTIYFNRLILNRGSR